MSSRKGVEFNTMKRVTYIFFLLLAFTTTAVQSQSAKQYFKAGEDFSKAMNYADAIKQFSKAIELDPDYEKAYINRADANSKIGEHENAARDYDRAVVIRFESREDFLKWYKSEDYQEILKFRLKAADCDTILVKGE